MMQLIQLGSDVFVKLTRHGENALWEHYANCVSPSPDALVAQHKLPSGHYRFKFHELMKIFGDHVGLHGQTDTLHNFSPFEDNVVMFIGPSH